MSRRAAASSSAGFEPVSPTAKAQPAAARGRTSRTVTSFVLLRSSLGSEVGGGEWLFDQGDVLVGVVVAHPVNAARKLVIRTRRGTFSVNEEDVERL